MHICFLFILTGVLAEFKNFALILVSPKQEAWKFEYKGSSRFPGGPAPDAINTIIRLDVSCHNPVDHQIYRASSGREKLEALVDHCTKQFPMEIDSTQFLGYPHEAIVGETLYMIQKTNQKHYNTIKLKLVLKEETNFAKFQKEAMRTQQVQNTISEMFTGYHVTTLKGLRSIAKVGLKTDYGGTEMSVGETEYQERSKNKIHYMRKFFYCQDVWDEFYMFKDINYLKDEENAMVMLRMRDMDGDEIDDPDWEDSEACITHKDIGAKKIDVLMRKLQLSQLERDARNKIIEESDGFYSKDEVVAEWIPIHEYGTKEGHSLMTGEGERYWLSHIKKKNPIFMDAINEYIREHSDTKSQSRLF